MQPWVQTLVTILGTVIASSGFWIYMQRRLDKNDAKTEMLIGLGHDRIVYLGLKHISANRITQDEYENLEKYLYRPYKKLGGNGSADRIMNEVDKLPICKVNMVQHAIRQAEE